MLVANTKVYEKMIFLKTLISDDNLFENKFLVLPAFREFSNAVLLAKVTEEEVRRLCFEIASTFYYTAMVYHNRCVDNRLNQYMMVLIASKEQDILNYTEEFIKAYINLKEKQIHNIVKNAKIYIAEHLGEDISVARLAKNFYLTANYFSRLFKKVEGKGCNEYIVCLRIEKAMSLLATTNYKTGKIAQMVGYHDNNYFSLSFKKMTGYSPTRYRESHQIVSD